MHRTYTTPLLDKLGVRPGMRIAVIGVSDEAFGRDLADRTGDITDGEPLPATDLVFLAADDHAALARLPDLRRRIVPNGAIWVVSRKGKAATLRDVDVIEAARSAGLVDNKVASFSDRHTALRLVIPRAMRPAIQGLPSAHAGPAPDPDRHPDPGPPVAGTEDAAPPRRGSRTGRPGGA